MEESTSDPTGPWRPTMCTGFGPAEPSGAGSPTPPGSSCVTNHGDAEDRGLAQGGVHSCCGGRGEGLAFGGGGAPLSPSRRSRTASRATPQNGPSVEVMGGYQVHAVGGFSGWSVSTTWNADENWGVVFDVTTIHAADDFSRQDEIIGVATDGAFTVSTSTTRVHRDLRVHVGAVGLRYRKATGRVRPFGQLLAGMMSYGEEDTPPPPRREYILSCTPQECVPRPWSPPNRTDLARKWMVWPGVGVDFEVADYVVVRFQADSTGFLSPWNVFPRILVGATYGFGSR